jgi:hypothetical protein
MSISLRDTIHDPAPSSFQIVCQADQMHDVNECFGEIKYSSKLSCGVVIRECVVVVVKAFSDREEGDPVIFSRTDFHIVWSMAKEMGSRIDEPGGVQDEYLAIDVRHEERGDDILIPADDRQHDGNQEGEDCIDGIIVPVAQDILSIVMHVIGKILTVFET